jgi:hypothetical protein
MKILINGVIYDSTKTPILIEFDDFEENLFGGMRKFVSAPEESTYEERQKLMEHTLIRCQHKNVETWNHGYHSICKDCGERDV